jgi:hypothetical protein
MKNILLILIVATIFGCQQNTQEMGKPYVIEVTTFKYKASIETEDYWQEDANVEDIYTSKQPGFIKRESGFSEEKNEVVVVVYWKTNEDAEASMQKFMQDSSVVKFANMIDGSTMKMARYTVK